MKEFNGKLGTNGEQTHDELMEQMVDKWWYKFSYGIFTDEQLNMFYEDLNTSNLEYSEVIMAMLCKKRDTYLKRFDPMDK